MLLLLPFLIFIATFINLRAFHAARPQPSGSRLAFLQAAAFVGAFVALSAELLSLFKGLTPAGLSAAWILALLVVGGTGWRKGWLSAGANALIRSLPSLGWFEIAAFSGFALIAGLLFVVAILSPPNNTDSLLYHMSRVAHWAQNQSLRHYATGFYPQLVNPIFAETTILHLRLLWGDDRLANLVQWLSMVGSLIGVTLAAKLLGASRRGQLVAAAFALSIPMGLMQATSTQNDYVVAFWLISLLCFAALRVIRALTWDEELAFGLVLALGLLTKGTFYPYAAPVVIWFFIHQIRGYGLRTSIARGFLVAVPVIMINFGYWLRNTLTFGGPLGASEWIDSMTFLPRTVMAVTAAMARNTIMHFVTPNEDLNARIADAVRAALGSYDQTLVNLQLTWGWNHEDLAGNPLHVVLVAITVLGLVLARKRFKSRLPLEYSLVVASLFVMLALVVKFDPWGIRYQLPYWVAWAPLFGVVLAGLTGRYVASAAVFGLLLATIPWSLFNSTRPIIGMQPDPKSIEIPCFLRCTHVGSILEVPAVDLLFANWRLQEDSAVRAADNLRESGCQNVGLRIDSHDKEYWFWWLLDAPQSGIHIETVYPVPELAKLFDPDYRPCAVICTICGDRTELHGLPLVGDYGAVKLYVGDSYVPEAY